MNKERDIIIRTPVGNTKNTKVKKQENKAHYLDPSCAVQKNSIGEEVKYRYGKINIRIPVLMNYIATPGW